MSTYYTVVGVIQFDTREDFEEAVNLLKKSKLLTDDGMFRTEAGANPPQDDGSDIDSTGLAIEIPFNTYRNFLYLKEQILANAVKYGLVWTCTDGEFTGGYETHNDSKELQLEEWAVSNGFDSPPETTTDEKFQSYVNWQSEVKGVFFEENSMRIPT